MSSRIVVTPRCHHHAVEPTGGSEKPLVGALHAAGLPVEIVCSTRFAAYRKLVGAKAKSDTSDARLLAAFAAAPAEVRGRSCNLCTVSLRGRAEFASHATTWSGTGSLRYVR